MKHLTHVYPTKLIQLIGLFGILKFVQRLIQLYSTSQLHLKIQHLTFNNSQHN